MVPRRNGGNPATISYRTVPETEDVRPMIRAQAAGLLRRHVDGCAHDPRALNAVDRYGLGRVAAFVRADQFRDAEVQDFDPSVGGEEQIGRLDITVHDAALYYAANPLAI